MTRRANLDETGMLEMTDDAAFGRGVELASDEEFNAFVAALGEMRKQTTYSNQDYDRRAHMGRALRELRNVGRMPLARRAA